MMGFGYRTQADKRILYEIKLINRQIHTRVITIKRLNARIDDLKRLLQSSRTKESLKKAGE